MSIREQISAEVIFYPDGRVVGGLLINAHTAIDMAEARERELLDRNEQLIAALKALPMMEMYSGNSDIYECADYADLRAIIKKYEVQP